MGAQGNGNVVVRIPPGEVGAGVLRALAFLGGSLPPETDGGGGQDAPAAPGEHPDVPEAPDDERQERSDQFEDPVGQVHGPRLPQRVQLHHGDLFPLRRPQHEPLTHLKPGRALLRI